MLCILKLPLWHHIIYTACLRAYKDSQMWVCVWVCACVCLALSFCSFAIFAWTLVFFTLTIGSPGCMFKHIFCTLLPKHVCTRYADGVRVMLGSTTGWHPQHKDVHVLRAHLAIHHYMFTSHPAPTRRPLKSKGQQVPGNLVPFKCCGHWLVCANLPPQKDTQINPKRGVVVQKDL